jgi:hypothetical protein
MPDDQSFWMNHVELVLERNCFKCHGGVKQKGGLDLRLPSSILQGGDDGSVVMPGRPDESQLYQRIVPGAKDHMPPDESRQLDDQEISVIRHWIAILPIAPSAHPTTGPANWAQKTPSLIELATATHWSPPAGMEPSAAIDHLLEKARAAQHVSAAPLCDDRSFVHRVYLDLAGRIPTPAEVSAFLASADPRKRSRSIDQLLDSQDYARHMAELLNVLLLERKGAGIESKRKAHGWFDFLHKSIAANKPWNQVVAELIVARPKTADDRGAVQFLYEDKNNPQLMAEEIAPVVFGVSIGCAQCHNHPLAHEIQQKHYWGLVTAFNRTSNADTPTGPALSESAVGGFVNFTNLKKESQPALMALLNGREIAEIRPADGAKESDSDANYITPPSADKKHPNKAAIPKTSRRAALAEAVTKDNPLLARAMVNRVWAILMGRGLVNPVNQMDSRHVPSHPELLAWLAEDFQTHNYDVKRLIRIIAQSRAYQLSSRWSGSSLPPSELYARALEKPLTAEMLCRSLLDATGPHLPGRIDAEALRRRLIEAFPAVAPMEYNPSLQQAMFLTNNPLLDALLKADGQNLTARLLELKTSRERVAGAFNAVLGRPAAEDELKQAAAYLDSRAGEGEAALRQLEWALLSSAEFLMIH